MSGNVLKTNLWLEEHVWGYAFCERWSCKIGRGIYDNLPEKTKVYQLGSSILSGAGAVGSLFGGAVRSIGSYSIGYLKEVEWRKHGRWLKEEISNKADWCMRMTVGKILRWGYKSGLFSYFAKMIIAEGASMGEEALQQKISSMSFWDIITSAGRSGGSLLVKTIENIVGGIWWLISAPFKGAWALMKMGKDCISFLIGKVRKIDFKNNCVVSAITTVAKAIFKAVNWVLGGILTLAAMPLVALYEGGKLLCKKIGKINLQENTNTAIKVITDVCSGILGSIVFVGTCIYSEIFLVNCMSHAFSLVPEASLEYLTLMGKVSLDSIFMGGVIVGIAALAIRIICSEGSIKNLHSSQNEGLNILMGIGICVVASLSPVDGVIVSLAAIGFWAVKAVYRVMLGAVLLKQTLKERQRKLKIKEDQETKKTRMNQFSIKVDNLSARIDLCTQKLNEDARAEFAKGLDAGLSIQDQNGGSRRPVTAKNEEKELSFVREQAHRINQNLGPAPYPQPFSPRSSDSYLGQRANKPVGHSYSNQG